MINTNMRFYDFFTFGKEDAYGQAVLSEAPQGKIKISINLTNQSTQDNINYKSATYVGLTMDNVKDNYVIDYNGNKLKVLYITPIGLYKQVFMGAL